MTITLGNSYWLIAAVFIVLKLTGVISWGWLWVLSPIWLPVVMLLIVGIIWRLFGLNDIHKNNP